MAIGLQGRATGLYTRCTIILGVPSLRAERSPRILINLFIP